jgi:DNA invertase Pin-like site-specific DNA recombinase
MGSDHSRSRTPDLFSTAADRERSSLSANEQIPAPLTDNVAASASLRRHVLPRDLPQAIKHLDDQELDRLLAAVLAEQKRRGRKLSVSGKIPHKQRVAAVAAPLTTSKINAVHAALKAGVSPSRIARQFGISQSDVRRALQRAGESPGRK